MDVFYGTSAVRSLAFWQDVRVGRSKMDTDARPLEPQHSRSSVAGLSVEYSKRWYDAGGAAGSGQVLEWDILSGCALRDEHHIVCREHVRYVCAMGDHYS